MPTLDLNDRRSLRRAASALTLALLVVGALAGTSKGDLASRFAAGQQRAQALQSQLSAQNHSLERYRGTIDSLQVRLQAIQGAVVVQEQLLAHVRSELVAARARLTFLQGQFARDRAVLAAELRAEYESPAPTIVGVVVDARGFEDLLSRLSDLHAIEQRNTQTIVMVRDQRRAVQLQARRLAALAARRERATAAVLVERDQVAQLRLSIVDKELAVARSRAQTSSRLSALRKRLAHEALVLGQQAAAAQAASSGGAAASAGGACVNTPLHPHGGSFGFFQGPGTDYSAGVEPIIAARLDQLGSALQLHLVGISGYRTPQHSVEVGGFADDPHTRGQASDTPGVEGVPEATLERFCLTRPFGGAAEADHIQLL